MINYKEVRIGNLVKYEDRIFEIHTISEEFPTLNTSEFGIGVVGWKNLEPIPLTEEWPIKFGFIFYKKKYFIGVNFGRYSVHKVGDIFDHWYFNHEHDKTKGLTSSIRFVHQLQNMFQCHTGEELQLK